MDISNPFSSAIVSDAWHPLDSDVEEIHAEVFDQCCASIEAVCRNGHSRSMLLHGLPGSGKTHLLARLRTHLTQGIAQHGKSRLLPGSPRVLFTAVRLRAGPRMICRHLRHTLASDLFRATGDGMTQLERVLLHRFANFFKSPEKAHKWWMTLRKPDSPRKWWMPISRSTSSSKAERQVEILIDKLDEEELLGRNLCTILYHLALSRHRRDVRDWLRDGALPETVMGQMGLVADPEDEDAEERALGAVCALSRLANADIPLVLCFDQVEALQTHPQDIDGLFAFGRMVSSLRDKTRNTLLISCVQTAFMDTLDQVIRGADMDRLAEKEALLKPLSWREAERLVIARLESSPQLILEQNAGNHDRIWPLRRDHLKQFFQGSGACTPRQLISFCDDEFEIWRQGKAEPLLPVEDFLALQFKIAQEHALRNADPLLTDEIVAHALPLAMEVLGQGRSEANFTQKAVDLVLNTPSGKRCISFCNQGGHALTARLKHLLEAVKGNELPHLVLLRDHRIAVSRHAKKARELLVELQESGVPMVRPSAEAISALEALRSLLSDAKSGDLSNHGQSIPFETTRTWLANHMPFSLTQLLHEVLSEREIAVRDKLYDELLELVQRQHIVRLTEAARELGCEENAVQACLRQHGESFGFIPGPPAVVYQWVTDNLAGSRGG